MDSEKIVHTWEELDIPIRISVNQENGYPITISLWYVIIGGLIYCATKNNSKVVKILEKNQKCGFEIASDKPPYRGLRGFGEAIVLEEMGKEILDLEIKKYLGKNKSKLSDYLIKHIDSEVAIQITPKKIFRYDYSERMKGAITA